MTLRRNADVCIVLVALMNEHPRIYLSSTVPPSSLNLATICSASSLGTFCLSMDGSFSTISFDCCGVACGVPLTEGRGSS